MECQTLVFEAPASKRHKLKPGENLSRIASKHGLKNWKGIWDAKGNSKLKSKRKKPELLQPGDILVIPPSPEMLKRAQSNHAKALKAHVARIDERSANARRTMDMLIKARQSAQKTINELHKSNAEIYKAAVARAETIDNVQMVLDAKRSAVRLAKHLYRGMKMAGEELAKHNRELRKELVKDLGKKNAELFWGLLPEEKVAMRTDPAVLAAGKIVVDSLFKITSVSYWDWTITQFMDGRSLEDALTTGITTEYKREKKKIQALGLYTDVFDRRIRGLQDVLRALKECKEQAIAAAPARF